MDVTREDFVQLAGKTLAACEAVEHLWVLLIRTGQIKRNDAVEIMEELGLKSEESLGLAGPNLDLVQSVRSELERLRLRFGEIHPR